MKFTPSGYTVVEVLVALLIMSIVIAFSASSFTFNVRSNHNAEIRSEASQAGQTVLDQLRRLPIDSLRTTGTDSQTVNVNSARSYTVAVRYCGESQYCTSSEVRHLGVTVSRNNEVVYRTETVYTNLGDADGGETDNSSTTTIITTTTSTSTSRSTTVSTTTTSTTSTSRSTSTTSTSRRTTTSSVRYGGGGCHHYGC